MNASLSPPQSISLNELCSCSDLMTSAQSALNKRIWLLTLAMQAFARSRKAIAPHYLRVPHPQEILAMLPRLFHPERKKDSPWRALFHGASGSAGTLAEGADPALCHRSHRCKPRFAAIHRNRTALHSSLSHPAEQASDPVVKLDNKITECRINGLPQPQTPGGRGAPLGLAYQPTDWPPALTLLFEPLDSSNGSMTLRDRPSVPEFAGAYLLVLYVEIAQAHHAIRTCVSSG